MKPTCPEKGMPAAFMPVATALFQSRFVQYAVASSPARCVTASVRLTGSQACLARNTFTGQILDWPSFGPPSNLLIATGPFDGSSLSAGSVYVILPLHQAYSG